VLADRDHAVGFRTSRRPVLELRHLFRLQPQDVEFPLADDPVLHLLRGGPRRPPGAAGWASQRFPRLRWQGFGKVFEVRPGVVAEDELRAEGVPAVEVLGLSSIMSISTNKLTTSDRVAILRVLTEGCSMRSTSRMVGVSINTVSKVLVEPVRSTSTTLSEISPANAYSLTRFGRSSA